MTKWLGIAALALLGCALIWVVAAPGSTAEPRTVRPLPADSIVDFIGVNVHFGYPDTGYRFLTPARPAPNGTSILALLQTLGVRHARSGVLDTESKGLGSATPSEGPRGRCPAFQSAAASGEDFELVTDINDNSAHINTSAADLGVAVACFGPYAARILAIEGPNERGSGRNCNGTEPPPAPSMAPYVGTFRKNPTSECIPEILGQQRIMWLARQNHILPPTTQLWSAAFANTSCEEEYDVAHYTDRYGKHLVDYVDAVTSHAYLAFNEPEFTGGPGPYRGVPCSATSHLNGGLSATTYNFINDAEYGTLKYYFEAARYSGVPLDGSAPPKPVVMTETGYEAQCCGNADTDVDVPTVAKYTLRELLAAQAAGFSREYIYELVSDSESLGLTDQYLNPKPVFYALENFIKLLRDPGYATLTTQPLALAISAPADVRSQVYQKHDGSNWLVAWQIDRGYDHATMTALPVAPVSATVTLASRPSSLTAYVFDPLTGAASPHPIAPATSFALPVSDMPVIVQIGGTPVTALAVPVPPVFPVAVQRRQSVICVAAGAAPVTCKLPQPLDAAAARRGHLLVVTAVGNASPSAAPNAAFTHDGGTSCANSTAEVAHRVVAPGDPPVWTFTPGPGAGDTQFTLDELENAQPALTVAAGCITPRGTSYRTAGRIMLPDYAGLESFVALRMAGSSCGTFDVHEDNFAQLQKLDAKVCSHESPSGGATVFAEGSTFGGYSAGHTPTLKLPGVRGLADGEHAALTWWIPPTE